MSVIIHLKIPGHSPVSGGDKEEFRSSTTRELFEKALDRSPTTASQTSISSRSISDVSSPSSSVELPQGDEIDRVSPSLEGSFYQGTSALNKANALKGAFKRMRSIPLLKQAINCFNTVIEETPNISLKFKALCKKIQAQRALNGHTGPVFAQMENLATAEHFAQLSTQDKIAIGRSLYAHARAEDPDTEKGVYAAKIARKWFTRMIVNDNTKVSTEGQSLLSEFTGRAAELAKVRVVASTGSEYLGPLQKHPAFEVQAGKQLAQQIPLSPIFSS